MSMGMPKYVSFSPDEVATPAACWAASSALPRVSLPSLISTSRRAVSGGNIPMARLIPPAMSVPGISGRERFTAISCSFVGSMAAEASPSNTTNPNRSCIPFWSTACSTHCRIYSSAELCSAGSFAGTTPNRRIDSLVSTTPITDR